MVSEVLDLSLIPKETRSFPDFFGESIRVWCLANSRRKIRTLSLFSGAGGLDIGFNDAGFELVTHVEIDSRFGASLDANSEYFGNSKVVVGDVREFVPEDKGIDFVIGGPPCQTFSAAGRRASGVQGVDDPRGTLFEEYIRVLEALRPKGFLFENVYGIVGAQGGSAWNSILTAFTELGYEISHRILDAADYGTPQHRERLIIVGSLKAAFRFPAPTHGPDSPSNRPFYTAFEALKGVDTLDEQVNQGVNGRYGHLLSEVPPGLNYSFFTSQMGHPNPLFAWRSKFSDFLYKADPKKPVRAIKAQGGQYTGPFHWESRPFAICELKRLQTFPDNYKIVGGRQVAIHQIGNSVPPQFARVLALAVRQQLFGMKIPCEMPLLSPGCKLGFRTRKRGLSAEYADKARVELTKEITSVTPRFRGKKQSYLATLTEDFDWIVDGNESNGQSMEVIFDTTGKKWSFNVRSFGAKLERKSVFKIVVKPVLEKPWSLPAEQVTLSSNSQDFKAVTGVWKALEFFLSEAGLKADLVQLNGYYQYRPSIKAEIELGVDRKDGKDWQLLAAIMRGDCVGKTQDLEWFVDKLSLDNTEFRRAAEFLKSLGFEIRNSWTNPQIPEDYYLIPYAFPTLSPKSVQLRKSLVRV